MTKPLDNVYVDILEVINEPNLTWWPQREPNSDALRVHRWAARMVHTAREMTKQTQNAPIIMAPATSDVLSSTRNRTDYQEFTNAFLTRCAEIGFTPDDKVLWSQHNYGDVTYDLGPGTTVTTANAAQHPEINRAQWTHQRLTSGWTGFGGSAGYLFLTEGGVTTENIKLKYGATTTAQIEGWRSSLMYRAFKRMQDPTVGAGILLFTNYLVYGEPYVLEQHDTGLLTPTVVRQPTYNVWKCLPTC